MASSSTMASPVKKLRPANWLKLPRDVMASILSRLGAIEIMTSVQMVCKTWLDICKDPLMWRTIDMRILGDTDTDLDLEKMCSDVVDRSCGQLVDINIEDFGTNELLRYITASSSQIKRLRLACCHYVSDEGLIEAIEKLPLLEELDLTLCSFSESPLKALGRCCPHFKTLKLNTQACKLTDIDPDEEEDVNWDVFVIGENFPKLRHLQLIGNSMTNKGLEAILDGCPHLESLDLRRCLNINLKGKLAKRCAEQIKNIRLPQDSLKGYGFIADPDRVFCPVSVFNYAPFLFRL
ncbi:putative F-box/LRR-repeat protein 23 [Humulus lupulus]|uniref:putative F-box/LRR-repeat protein 23 n=1 Tax=Humulus lupulus TaxID=3486 RepID=UPI002B40F8CE|nr:putative F-box/LRR-repeat protein 23 [Humulus lupulus]